MKKDTMKTKPGQTARKNEKTKHHRTNAHHRRATTDTTVTPATDRAPSAVPSNQPSAEPPNLHGAAGPEGAGDFFG